MTTCTVTEPVTSRERVMAALDHRKPDRMPVFNSFWPEFKVQWLEQKPKETCCSVEDYYGIDIQICAADETPFPSRKEIVWQQGMETLSRDGYGRLVRSVLGAYFDEYLEYPIAGPEDLEANPFDSADLASRYGHFVKKVKRQSAKRCCFCKVGGPYLRAANLRGETQFLIDIVTDPPFAREMADRMADFLTAIGLASLARGDLYDTGIWIYDDIAYNHNPMFSPASFEEVFLPAYKRMISAFKGAGANKVILHSDGNIFPVLDMLVDAGIDGINPVEPRAGMDVIQLKKKYGERLSMVGGMCNAFVLPKGTDEEIRMETLRILDAGREGGIVIGTHSIGPDVPISSYDLFHRVVREEGNYSQTGG